MNEGILQSSPLQQMVGASSLQHHSLLAAPPQNHHLAPPLTAPLSWAAASQELPHSWSQLVLGFAGEDDMENWEQQLLLNNNNNNNNNSSGASNGYTARNLEFAAVESSSSPPKSCVTTSSIGTNIFSFSNKSSENLMKGKKSKMNPTTSAQSGIKVRKEKLGDRITALHQIVSPFGKTDTASVLLEAIGYIRFLQSQIEALSLPYLASGNGSGSPNFTPPAPVKRERTCLFPDDPGQLLNENRRKRRVISNEEYEEESKKDLKSRGLCLVPLSCTVDFGSENGADYWAPAFNGNFQ